MAVASCPILAGVGKAVVYQRLAVGAAETRCTMASVGTDAIYAGRVVLTRVRQAVVDVVLATLSGEADRTHAARPVLQVMARAIIGTGVVGAGHCVLLA